MTIDIRRANEPDAARVTAIYNDAITDRTATFETAHRTTVDLIRRITESPRYPVLVAATDTDVLAWAGISAYRPRECYAGIGEFSIYVDRAYHRRGIGKRLLDALIQDAARLGYWKLLSRIFPFNTGSLALCRACGFREVGVYERHAQLDGRWLDVVIVERLIAENQPGA